MKQYDKGHVIFCIIAIVTIATMCVCYYAGKGTP